MIRNNLSAINTRRDALVLLLALGGCTTIDMTSAPADWPQLEVSYVTLTSRGTQAACGGNTFFATLGCARISLPNRTCVILHNGERYVIEHEEAHCKGHDHTGSTHLRDFWNRWKAEQGVRQ